MSDTLKPCPFCGGEAELERAGNTRISTIVRCLECGCGLENGATFNHGAAWNTRAAPTVKPLVCQVSASVLAKALEVNGDVFAAHVDADIFTDTVLDGYFDLEAIARFVNSALEDAT